MFVTVQDKIVAALKTITDFKTVGVWDGDIEDLLKNVTKLPSAHVLLSVAEFDEPKTVRGESVPADMTWTVIVMSQNLRDRGAGAIDSLSLIQKLVVLEPAGLTRLDTGHGRLWPAVVQFIAAENGKTAYGVKFYNKKGH